MMEFWTILVITYGGILYGNASYVALPNQPQCEEAMELMYDLLSPQMSDLMLQCIPTNTPSKSIRPMPRPKELE